MNKVRKAMLIAGCALSPLTLAGCNTSQDSSEGTNDWIIAEVGKYDILKKKKKYWINGTGSEIHFTTYDEMEYVASEYFLYRHNNKLSKELYDVEYGTKEWYDLTGNTETQSQNANYTFELTK